MRAFLIMAMLSVYAVGARGDLRPSDAKTPLFTIHEVAFRPDDAPDSHTHKADLGKAVLTVSTLRDLQFLPDDAVRVTLAAHDAKLLSELTHTHEFLVLVTGDEKGGVTMHISGPIDDGVITFRRANYGTDVTHYLRRRYPKAQA